ncbi:hypothetical protein DFS33DRAFT_783045 [Desarmillaria ectypa]|nr:hypothetical protein DFS33DRAFT_783045 [Desarmillaria ectypa]
MPPAARFLASGSLFFKEDVSPELQNRPLYKVEEHNNHPAVQKYRISPVVDKQYWFNEPIEGDRGPWPNMTSFIQATCRWGPDLPPVIRYEGSLIPFLKDPFSLPEMPLDNLLELK